ncbi:MAG: ABC transporter permease [Oscillospiraceae bacterium]|nr:ABC transporter permease [Oscillospiraceae bacterium]
MKIFDILITATRNLFRSKVRTFLTISAVFIGTFAIALTVGLNIGVTNFLNQEIGALGAEDVLMVWKNTDEPIPGFGTDNDGPRRYVENELPPAQISQSEMDEILNLDNVSEVIVFRMVSVNNIRVENSERYHIPLDIGLPNMNMNLLSGEHINHQSENPEIVLSYEFVEVFGFSDADDAIGREVIFEVSQPDGYTREVAATIVGIHQISALVMGAGGGGAVGNAALIDEISAINMYGLPEEMVDAIFFLAVVVDDIYEMEYTREVLTDMGLISQTLEEQVIEIMGIVNAISAGIILFGAIALMAALFGIVNTLYMSVQERTREIGLMKALGLGKRKIFLIFCWEAAMIGFFGAAIGLLAAMGVGSIINQVAAETFLSTMPGFQLITFTLVSSLMVILIVMFIAFLAGTLPAKRASKMDPITALRVE